jgi:hypothetical protein
MQRDFRKSATIRTPTMLIAIVVIVLGSLASLGNDAAGNESELAILLQAGYNANDDQDLSLRPYQPKEALRDDQAGARIGTDADDDQSTESMLDFGDFDENDRGEDQGDDDDEALRVVRSKQTAVASALVRLRKPLDQVRVVNAVGLPSGPANQAAMHIGESANILITDSGSAVPSYLRRTVCFSHRPLYFEQPNLERCGNGHGCLTNPLSAFRFVGSLALLPCQMVKQPPNCPVHCGSDCRCGQTITADLNPFPIDLRAAAVQTATAAGFTFLLL